MGLKNAPKLILHLLIVLLLLFLFVQCISCRNYQALKSFPTTCPHYMHPKVGKIKAVHNLEYLDFRVRGANIFFFFPKEYMLLLFLYHHIYKFIFFLKVKSVGLQLLLAHVTICTL